MAGGGKKWLRNDEDGNKLGQPARKDFGAEIMEVENLRWEKERMIC